MRNVKGSKAPLIDFTRKTRPYQSFKDGIGRKVGSPTGHIGKSCHGVRKFFGTIVPISKRELNSVSHSVTLYNMICCPSNVILPWLRKHDMTRNTQGFRHMNMAHHRWIGYNSICHEGSCSRVIWICLCC